MATQTPEQVADSYFANHTDVSTENTVERQVQIKRYITEAVAIDRFARESQAASMVVSTHDGRVRTGVINRTVKELLEVIAGYMEDGYTAEELVIEGITE